MVGFLVTILVVGLVVLYYVRKAKIKAAYQEALRGTDKVKALACGRAYYASIRKSGVLTTYDEAAINNDISAMRTE